MDSPPPLHATPPCPPPGAGLILPSWTLDPSRGPEGWRPHLQHLLWGHTAASQPSSSALSWFLHFLGPMPRGPLGWDCLGFGTGSSESREPLSFRESRTLHHACCARRLSSSVGGMAPHVAQTGIDPSPICRALSGGVAYPARTGASTPGSGERDRSEPACLPSCWSQRQVPAQPLCPGP